MNHTLIIGLGNPDPLLEETYHNVGILAMDWLAARAAEQAGISRGTSGAEDAAPHFRAHHGVFAYKKIGTRIFIRPLVFMNDSGRAVQEALRAFNATPENIVVLHDDSDITIGAYKRTVGGRAAGHKGIQSIIDHLHTDAFARVRIGIREKNEVHRKKAADFVLSPISAKDKKIFAEVFEKISAELTRD